MSGYRLIFPDYKDPATGKTLVVTPGSTFDAVLSPGRINGTPAHPDPDSAPVPDSAPAPVTEEDAPVTAKAIKKTKEGA